MTVATIAQDRSPGNAGASAVLGYVRVSTADQADSGAGLAAQRASLEAEAQRRGWALEIVEDAGFSAKTLARPGLLAALERLSAGEASVLVVSRLDRLSRSMLDFSGLMARSQAEGWSLVALDLGVDTTTAEGELMANVRASFSAYERRLISIRTKEAMAAKRAQGVKFGRPPRIPAAACALAHDLRATGMEYAHIGLELSRAGFEAPSGTWHASTVYKLVKRAA